MTLDIGINRFSSAKSNNNETLSNFNDWTVIIIFKCIFLMRSKYCYYFFYYN